MVNVCRILFAAGFLSLLAMIAYNDWKTMKIPNKLIIITGGVGLASTPFFTEISLMERGIGVLCISILLLIITCIVPGSFGGGDIKLMFGAGFFLGAKLTVVAAFIGILLGGGFGALLLAQKKANRKSQFAFGPFLCIGIAIAMFFGETIADWYMGLL